MDVKHFYVFFATYVWACNGQITATPTIGTCETVFVAEDATQVFRESCEPVTFPCFGTLGYIAVPGDCNTFYQCNQEDKILRCPCAPGTAFNITQKACVSSFYKGCNCPNGNPTPPPVETTTTSAAPVYTSEESTTTGDIVEPSKSSNVGAIVGGVIGAVLGVAIIAGLIFLFCCRNKAETETAQKPPRAESIQYDNNGYDRQISGSSGVYSYINEGAVSSRGSLPPLPAGASDPNPHYADRLPSQQGKDDDKEDDKNLTTQTPSYVDVVAGDGDTEPVYDNKFA